MGNFLVSFLAWLDRRLLSLDRVRLDLQNFARQFPDVALLTPLVLLAGGVISLGEIHRGDEQRLPITVAWIGSAIGMLGLPVLMVLRHRWRQQRALDKIRSLYALGIEYLARGRRSKTRSVLRSILRWEYHWRLGNSLAYRLAYGAAATAATMALATAHFVLQSHIDSQINSRDPHATLLETVRYLYERPAALWLIALFVVVYGIRALDALKDLSGQTWAEFYGEKLAAALRAGRRVNPTPQREQPRPAEVATAREIFGLPERFTSAELRRAWLRLVRELHPDRWETAGEGVRQMKEAALKRVNAARDELEPQAVG